MHFLNEIMLQDIARLFKMIKHKCFQNIVACLWSEDILDNLIQNFIQPDLTSFKKDLSNI
jgi:hypothetical protein